MPYSGHPGYGRTLEIARRNWYWKGMASEVRDFVLDSVQFARKKRVNHKGRVGNCKR